MLYKGYEIKRGSITLSSGLKVSGYIVEMENGARTVCQDEELAKRYVDMRRKRMGEGK